jgi:hypothetical protein
MRVLLGLIMTVTIVFQSFSQRSQIYWKNYDYRKWTKIESSPITRTAFTEYKKFYIADFSVDQVTFQKYSDSKEKDAVFTKLTFTGVQKALYFKIVNQLYEDLVKQFEDNGYELLSEEDVKNSLYLQRKCGKKGNVCYVGDSNVTMYTSSNNVLPGTEFAAFRPVGKYMVVSDGGPTGMFYYGLARDLEANIITIHMNINYVGLGGGHDKVEEEGPVKNASPYMYMFPGIQIATPKGQIWVNFEKVPFEGLNNWAGDEGWIEFKEDYSFFGDTKGGYMLDIKEDIYLNQVKNMVHGVNLSVFDIWFETINQE